MAKRKKGRKKRGGSSIWGRQGGREAGRQGGREGGRGRKLDRHTPSGITRVILKTDPSIDANRSTPIGQRQSVNANRWWGLGPGGGLIAARIGPTFPATTRRSMRPVPCQPRSTRRTSPSPKSKSKSKTKKVKTLSNFTTFVLQTKRVLYVLYMAPFQKRNARFPTSGPPSPPSPLPF
ncbi:hypothetical protein K504DRAFT_281090 [Pleomassaria siparia CBS 279.74]|uniref:Uncharacterized protein n=1 Tax=Pleomassaria siparia CBS 279.74 TaxID=1314801 RepID=A0A6G1KAQ7_9PLEO|nr:hypothetical protein K504DRAFT_281090 [Pleomassaria siparia CBS 279.74]